MSGIFLKTSRVASSVAFRPTRLPLRSAAIQSGLTLIELLVALVVSLVVILAAVSALTVSRQGFSTVDAASQLRDNARFAVDLIQRLGVQTGYRDVVHAATVRDVNNVRVNRDPDPNLFGANNSTPSPSFPQSTFIARTSGEGLGSDILIMRHQASETYTNSGVADGAMIDCAGINDLVVPSDRDNRMTSIIHVAVSQGEPSLMCTTVNAAGTIADAQPIIRGVENFQILYGTYGVTPNTATASLTAADLALPDRYLRADQLTVAGNGVATNNNWKRVRSIRIGMVLRAGLNTAQNAAAQTYHPLGQAKDSATGTAGSAFSSAADVGSVYTPPQDGRLRQVVTFSVHFRNAQDL